MATVTIRNLDETVLERLKNRAKTNDRSLESELRVLLAHAASGIEPQEFVANANRIRRLHGRPRQAGGAPLPWNEGPWDGHEPAR